MASAFAALKTSSKIARRSSVDKSSNPGIMLDLRY